MQESGIWLLLMEGEATREHELLYCKTCFEGRLWGKKDINEGVNMETIW